MFLQEIQLVEFEDDNLCMMQGLEFKDEDTRTLYWKCRLRVINQRIANQEDNYGYSLLFKGELKKLKKAIQNKIDELNETTLVEIETSIDEKEHQYCVTLRNNGSDMTYFECREELARKRKVDDDLEILNNEEFVDNAYQIEEVITNNQITIVDEQCIQYVYNEIKLNQCLIDNQNFIKCMGNINNQLEERRINDKLYCNQVSINRYPDSLFNNQGQNNNDMMVGPSMNKNNIINLRNKEYETCFRQRLIKLQEYREYLENQCTINNFSNLK